MALPSPTLLTTAEYLALERESRERHEFVGGKIFAMAGASANHNRLVVNLAAGLRQALRGGPCEAFVVDQRVKVSALEFYAYPDAVIVCGSAEFEDERRDTLLNPKAIIEVLSPSTEAYDRGRKFLQYRRLPSLVEYVLVSQDRPLVDHYVRQGDHWLLTTYEGKDTSLVLSSAPASLPLVDLYERVELASEPESIPRDRATGV